MFNVHIIIRLCYSEALLYNKIQLCSHSTYCNDILHTHCKWRKRTMKYCCVYFVVFSPLLLIITDVQEAVNWNHVAFDILVRHRLAILLSAVCLQDQQSQQHSMICDSISHEISVSIFCSDLKVTQTDCIQWICFPYISAPLVLINEQPTGQLLE